jgi:hypothetical protein
VAHTANSAMQMFSQFVWGRIIPRNLWPFRSPDLSPLGYVFGVLKENVHKNSPHTLEELKKNTKLFISKVTAETLHRDHQT